MDWRRLFKSPWYWAAVGTGVGVYFLVLRPSRASAAAPDDVVGTLQGLASYLGAGGNFGTKAQPSSRVAQAQRALLVADDGIVGPITRAAARKYGVELPLRRGAPAPSEDVPPSEWKVTVGTATLTPAAAAAGAVEPEPAKVSALPRAQKGTLTLDAKIELTGAQSFASASQVKDVIQTHLGKAGPLLTGCEGAPQLTSTPAVDVTDQRGGRFDVRVRWPAMWQGPGIPSAMKTCLGAKARQVPELAKVLTSLSVGRA